MADVRRITVEVPAELLERAQAASGESLPATVCTGLRLVAAGPALMSLHARRGTVRLSRSVEILGHDRG